MYISFRFNVIAEIYCHIQSILNHTSSTLRHMLNNIDAPLSVEILEKERKINRSGDKIKSPIEGADCRDNE